MTDNNKGRKRPTKTESNMKRNELFEKCVANVNPETRSEVERNMALSKEFLKEWRNAEIPAPIDAILWGMRKQKQIDEEQSAKELLYAVNKTAERTRKEVVEKACKWLMEHISGDVDCNDDGEPFAESFIEERKLAMQIIDDFRKAMEK